MPSILFLNRVKPPHRGASGWRLMELAVRLRTLGWRVTIVTDPEHHENITNSDKKFSWYYGNSLFRIFKEARQCAPCDIVVSLSDPPFLAAVGLELARHWGSLSIHWCHDLYPDLLPVVGGKKMAAAVPGLRALMRPVLQHCQMIVVGGSCMAHHLEREWHIPASQIKVFPLWPDPKIVVADLSRPGPDCARIQEKTSELRQIVGGEQRHIVVYAGNFGLSHPFSGILEAAACFDKDTGSPLFVLVGEGRQKAAVMAAVAARQIRNIRFLDWQPAESLPGLLALGDVHLAVMDPQAAGLMIPSKVSGILAAGRPCLFLGPEHSSAAQLARVGGEVLPPDNGMALAQALSRWLADPEARRIAGARGQAAVPWHADAAAHHFSRILENACMAGHGLAASSSRISFPAILRRGVR